MAFDPDVTRRRLKALGRNETDLATALGKTKSAMSRIMTGDRKNLSQSEAEAIEAALLVFEGNTARPAGLIPLLGYTAAGDDRIRWDLEDPLDWVEAPPTRLESSLEQVAVRIPGDLMDPRLFSGEIVYVALGISPARGGDVLIEFMDHTACIRTYSGRRQGYIFARQYNPDEEVRFEETKVRNLHAVTWRR